jgi:hypothetical protein
MPKFSSPHEKTHQCLPFETTKFSITRGFCRATRPCAARTGLVRRINKQNRALGAPLAHRSFAAPFLI